MAVIVQPEIGPTLVAEIGRQVVVVGAEIDRPANAIGVEHEGAEVKMTMAGRVVPCLNPTKRACGSPHAERKIASSAGPRK